MLQREYADLMNLDINFLTEEEYTQANSVYESHRDMDKQTFCHIWQSMGSEAREMTAAIAHEVNIRDRKIHALEKDFDGTMATYQKAIGEVDQHIATIEHYKAEATALINQKAEADGTILNAATELLKTAWVCTDANVKERIEGIVCQMVGVNGMLAIKIENGIELTDEDRTLLVTILGNTPNA